MPSPRASSRESSEVCCATAPGGKQLAGTNRAGSPGRPSAAGKRRTRLQRGSPLERHDDESPPTATAASWPTSQLVSQPGRSPPPKTSTNQPWFEPSSDAAPRLFAGHAEVMHERPTQMVCLRGRKWRAEGDPRSEAVCHGGGCGGRNAVSRCPPVALEGATDGVRTGRAETEAVATLPSALARSPSALLRALRQGLEGPAAEDVSGVLSRRRRVLPDMRPGEARRLVRRAVSTARRKGAAAREGLRVRLGLGSTRAARCRWELGAGDCRC